MLDDLPQRTKRYKGSLTNPDRWDKFTPRPGDIFVCTPPKSGTTWTQAICALLIFQDPNHGIQPGNISPWIDADLSDIEENIAMLEAQTHRRYIKTHTPLDGIPYWEDCSYLCCHRDPRDVLFSFRNHFDNMVMKELSAHVPKDQVEAFRFALRAGSPSGGGEDYSLIDLTNHLQTYWDYKHLPNVHLFHYADLKSDLVGEMRKISQALNIPVDEDLLPQLAEAATFSNMKENSAQYAPAAGMGFWEKDSDFFHSGTNNQWEGRLTEGDLKAYRDKMYAFLPAQAADWMERGSEGYEMPR